MRLDQFSICSLKIVHHNYLSQENQVPVNNLMLLLLKSKFYASTFRTYFDWYRYFAFSLNGQLICAAESRYTWLFFCLMIFVNFIEKFFAKT